MKRSIKALFFMLPLLVVLSVCTPVSTFWDNNMHVVEAAKKKVKLNCSNKTLLKGKTFQLKLKNNKKKIKWTSSKKSVASINRKGKVVAKKVGKTTITAKVGKKKYKCKITVENPHISNASLTVYQGEDINLYMEGTSQYYEWKSSNKSVVSINAYGEPRAVGVGECTVYTKMLGKTFSCKVKVKEPFVKDDALKAISKREVVTKSGILLYLTNNYMHDCRIWVDVTFQNGQKSIKSEDNNVVIGSQKSTVLFIKSIDDDGSDVVKFSQYSIKYDIDDPVANGYFICNDTITYSTRYGDNSVLAILNSSINKTCFVSATIIYYKDGKIIDADTDCTELSAKGSDIINFSFPYEYNEDYDCIYTTPDNYEVIISEAYYSE